MFIVVGGASRSGTSSISTFLHLHDDVTMCRTAKKLGSGIVSSMSENIRKTIKDKEDILQLFIEKRNPEQTSVWEEYIDRKNKDLLNGMSTEHIGVRWDYAEWSYLPFSHLFESGEAKLVFSMRDLKNVFMSLCFHGFLRSKNMEDNLKGFHNNISKSIEKIQKYGNSVCPVHVSNGSDFHRLLGWLNLNPSELQKLWISDPPVTNCSKKDGYFEYKEKISPKVRISKEIEDNYWSILRRARESYQGV